MSVTRRRFHDELDALEVDILAMGQLAEQAVGGAVEALVGRDDAEATAVISADDAIDDMYLSIERRILELLALQVVLDRVGQRYLVLDHEDPGGVSVHPD